MSNSSISLAKTTRPALSMVVKRERLFKKLDKVKTNKAVWIFGPPGSGKTTLMSSYIGARNRLSLWYQLDGDDADVASFFYYLRRAALMLCELSESGLPALPPVAQDWDNFSRQLFRAIFASFDQPLLMAFDNYEAIPPHSSLHDVFKCILEEVPAGSLLAFISRTSPPSSWARPLANNLITMFDADDLKLNKEEWMQIAKIRKAEVPSNLLDKILETTSGWITGSVIMLEQVKKSGQIDKRQFSAVGNILFDYVASEIYTSFDESTRMTLLMVCWPRRLNNKILEGICENASSLTALSTLAKNNYFVSSREEDQEHEFIIHPLLREFLQQKARAVFDVQTLNGIRYKTAELLIAEGQTEEAVELLAGNLDWDTLEPIIVHHAPLLIGQGRSVLLSGWLDELPRDRLDRNPWLLFWYGMACLKQAPREARHTLEQAFNSFKTEPESNREGMQLCCCGLLEVILAEMDDFSLLDNWLNEVLPLLDTVTNLESFTFSKSPEVLVMLTMMLRKPDDEKFAYWFQRTEAMVQSRSESRDSISDLFWLTLIYLLGGELVKAGESLVALRQLTQDQTDALIQCKQLLLTALHHVLSGAGAAADTAAREALTLAESNSFNTLLPFIHVCGCCAALIQNDVASADTWLAGTNTGNRLNRCLYHYALSWRCLINGETINAHHEQKRALNFAMELGIPYLEILSRTALGQLLYLCDDTRGVNAQLRRVHSIAREIKNPLLEFMTLLVYGDIATQQGRTVTGINALRYAFRLGREHAFYHLPWWHTTELAKVCAIALQHEIEVEYVREFIIRRSLQPVPLSIEVSTWPWPYRISTLGEQTVETHDGTRIDSGKNESRPLRLLMVLIAKGASDVSLNTVAEILWPHVDSEYATKSLTINLHRLRRLFNNDDTILLQDGRLALNDKLVWLDTWAFDHQLVNIEATITMPGFIPGESDIQDLFDSLLNIYRGAFLDEDEEYACFITARDQCRADFIRAVNMLVDTGHTRNIPLDVPEIYNRCLHQDPLAEGIYRRLLLWYLDADRYADAMDTYDRCRIAMAGSSQGTPSAEMQSMYNELVKVQSRTTQG